MHEVEAKALLTRWGGMNVYRGCTHGCIYCDSRSACYHIDHDFADVAVKANAPELLRQTLARRRKWQMVSTGSMSDPYQPIEADLQITRRCLEVICERSFGASVITKSDLVLRDLDLFADINVRSRAVLQVTLTIADDALSSRIEPGVCPSSRRREVISAFRERGIPTVVWLCPFLPFLTDTEENFRELLSWCVEERVAGIVCFGVGMTLREGSREHYYAALDRLYPGLTQAYRATYGDAYELKSSEDGRLMRLFHEVCAAHGIIDTPEACFAWMREPPERLCQPTLF